MSLRRPILKAVAALAATVAGLFAAGYALTWGDHRITPTVTEDTSLPRIVVNGIILHGETFGDPDAPKVVVLHGGPGGDYRSLLPLRALSDAFFVIFYDQRGSGLSERVPAEQLTLDRFIDDLDAVVDRFSGGTPVHLVGHSWGGGLAAAYVARHPGKIGRVVLAEPVPLTPQTERASGITYGASFDLRTLALGTRYWLESLHIDATDQHSRPDYLFTKMAPRANPAHHCDDSATDPDTAMWRSGALAIESVRASLLDAEGEFRDDLIEGIEAYREEILFLTGACSKLIGPVFQRSQLPLVPQARMVVLPDSGHLMFLDRPGESVAVVRDFLESDP